MTRQPSEKQITKAVFDHWHARGVPGSLIFANANMGAMGQIGLTRGVPDLSVHSPKTGVSYLELKTAKGTLSEHQQRFVDHCIGIGIGCVVAYGLDEALAALEDMGVLHREAGPKRAAPDLPRSTVSSIWSMGEGERREAIKRRAADGARRTREGTA